MEKKAKDLIWAILGAGNGGQSVAGHLGLLGFNVRIYDIVESTINAIQAQGGIELDGVVNGFGKVELATTSIQEALEGADFIMIIAPSTATVSIAKSCAPYLVDGQIVMLHPGSVFGALEFKKVVEENNCNSDITIVESHSLIYACRSKNPGQATILKIKDRLWISSIPVEQNNKVVTLLNEIYPVITAVDNVLITSFENTNCIVHPAATLLSTSLIESDKVWYFYKDGITPSVAKIIENIDKERMAIARALGIEKDILGIKEQFKQSYGAIGQNLYEAIKNTEGFDKIEGQKTLNTRYLTEDVPMGLTTLASLGKLLGVKVDLMNIIIKLSECLLDMDLSNNARNVKSLGLEGMTAKEIIFYAKTGIRKNRFY